MLGAELLGIAYSFWRNESSTGTKVLGTFIPEKRKFHRSEKPSWNSLFALKERKFHRNESSRKLKFLERSLPRNESSTGAKVPRSECSSSPSSSDFTGWVSSQLLLLNSLLSMNLTSLFLKISSDGASTTSCGNRFQQFTTLWLKKHILHCFSDLFLYSFYYVL